MRLRGRWLVFWFGILQVTFSEAQDQSNFTQFFTNPYLINSSYAGLDGQSAVSLIYRKQWMNIDGAPTIVNFSLQTPIDPKMSVGLSVTNDSKGLLNNSSLLATYAYHLKLDETSFVRFGISLGGTWNMIDLKKLESVSDPAIANLLDNNASLAGNAGISYQKKLFHIGLSIPTIFSPSYVSESAFSIKEVKPFQTLIFNASNRFYINNYKHIFEPYVLYRLNAGLKSQYEAAGVFHINHLVWLGGSYKQDFGISALAGVKVKNMVAIGASYSFQNSGINELNSPSFEITLNYLFGKHKKGAFIYSFVNAGKEKKPIHHTPATTVVASNKKPEPKKTEPVKQPVKQTTPAKTEPKTDPVKTEPVKTQVVTRDTTTNHNARFNQQMQPTATQPVIKEGHDEHEQEQLKRLELHAENPTEQHDGTVVHPHAERHEFVKQGNHVKELPIADYVVGGVFGKEENAKHFSDGLDKLGFDTHYGHLTVKNLWYVYVFKTDDIEKAKVERDNVRKMKLLKDAWLLTVHE
jgi:type IX secretion system PorP/SprF family membrane protein